MIRKLTEGCEKMRVGSITSFACSIIWLMVAPAAANCATDSAFQAAVEPVFRGVCLGCHNPQLASGGMNIQPFFDAKSLTESRDGWDIILQKLRAGEMPPAGIP